MVVRGKLEDRGQMTEVRGQKDYHEKGKDEKKYLMINDKAPQ
jgi:hypothetical protein